MVKSLAKDAASLVAVVIMWAIYSAGYLSLQEALEMLTVIVFITVLALGTEDVFRKLIFARKLITWQYAILMAFVLTCDFLWLYLADCDTYVQLAVRTLMLAVAAGGTVTWALFAYRISVMTDGEKMILAKSMAFRRIRRNFKDMSDEQVRTALESTLFCRLEGDRLEGRLLVSEPFHPESKTVTELQDCTDADSGTALSTLAGYIDTLVATRTKEQ